jgi:hypothetical protein
MAIHTLEEDDFPLEVRDEFHKLSAALTTPQKDIAIGTDPKVRTVNLAREACEGLDLEKSLGCLGPSRQFQV